MIVLHIKEGPHGTHHRLNRAMKGKRRKKPKEKTLCRGQDKSPLTLFSDPSALSIHKTTAPCQIQLYVMNQSGGFLKSMAEVAQRTRTMRQSFEAKKKSNQHQWFFSEWKISGDVKNDLKRNVIVRSVVPRAGENLRWHSCSVFSSIKATITIHRRINYTNNFKTIISAESQKEFHLIRPKIKRSEPFQDEVELK